MAQCFRLDAQGGQHIRITVRNAVIEEVLHTARDFSKATAVSTADNGTPNHFATSL